MNFDSDLTRFKDQSKFDSVYATHAIDTTLSSRILVVESITTLEHADSADNIFGTTTKHMRDTTSLNSVRITDFGYRIELYTEGLILEKRYYSLDKKLYSICYFKSSKPYKAIILDSDGKISWRFYLENDVWYSKSHKDNFHKAKTWLDFEMIEQMMLRPSIKMTDLSIK
jgi:hypothetical protein